MNSNSVLISPNGCLSKKNVVGLTLAVVIGALVMFQVSRLDCLVDPSPFLEIFVKIFYGAGYKNELIGGACQANVYIGYTLTILIALGLNFYRLYKYRNRINAVNGIAFGLSSIFLAIFLLNFRSIDIQTVDRTIFFVHLRNAVYIVFCLTGVAIGAMNTVMHFFIVSKAKKYPVVSAFSKGP